MSDLFRQNNAYTDISYRPAENSPVLEQYLKCEKSIDHQIDKMKNILEQDLLSNDIEQKCDPEIKKNCNLWFSKINCKLWRECGYYRDGEPIGFTNNIHKYIKNHGYLDKYDIDTTDWYNNFIIMYPNNNNMVRIDANNFIEPKIIRNPLFRHINNSNGRFSTAIYHDKIEPTIRIYRLNKINIDDAFDW